MQATPPAIAEETNWHAKLSFIRSFFSKVVLTWSKVANSAAFITAFLTQFGPTPVQNPLIPSSAKILE